MYKTRLCLGTSQCFLMSTEEQIKLFKQIGFDGFFTMWDENLKSYRTVADEVGMIYQSVHAPFKKASQMWKGNEEAQAAVEELLRCVKDCAEVEVPILVVHPYIGFDKKPESIEKGIENFGTVVRAAKQANVQIAFENVEGEECLAALMDAFKDEAHVGFCWDTGHETCYNMGKDMLALYGERLIATHINDNLGVSDYNGRTYWTDDLHLLPFDGIINWKGVAERLNRCRYDGILTFELTRVSKPNRHENDRYQKMDTAEYLTECYVRACRLAYLKQNL